MSKQRGVFVNNNFIGGSGEALTSVDPAMETVVWQGASAAAEDVDAVVQAARMAFPAWAGLALEKRKTHIMAFTEILKREKGKFAELISRETGKPLWESATELDAMINKTAIAFDAFDKRCGEVVESMPPAVRATRYKPHGVIAVLGPFNLPGHLPNGHIIPALLAGNTIVFKPSELTPGVGEKYMECWQEAGLPDGVINMVQGGKDAGVALVDHVDLNGLLFTGSYLTGRAIHKAWAGQPEKLLALEMGGNNPLIVDEVDDLKAAVYTTIQSAFITAGQRCVCARRLIVVENDQTDAFLSDLILMTRTVKVGPFTNDPPPFMGPLISKTAAQMVLEWQDQLIKRGGRLLVRCVHIDGKAMVSPGIIDSTDIENREDVEIFGPLLQVVRVKDLDAAINEANATAYGLAAGILTDNKEHYERFFQLSRCGVVNWNRPTTGASSKGPFGGVGKSGNFHPSAYFASDYCSYPVAAIEMESLKLPATLTPGIEL